MSHESRLELTRDDNGQLSVQSPDPCIGGRDRSYVKHLSDRELLERVFLMLEDAQPRVSAAATDVRDGEFVGVPAKR